MQPLYCSAADAEYFPLLKGLVLSLRRHAPDRSPKIAAVDLGLTSAQIFELNSMEVQIVSIDWQSEFPGRKEQIPWVLWLTARADLPRFVPAAEMYIWLDADAWLQDWRAIELLTRAAANGALGIVPELHRGYATAYQPGPLEEHQVYDFYLQSYDETIAKRLTAVPILNAGVFALRADSPIWKPWQQWQQAAAQNTTHKLTDQCALNAAIYGNRLPFHPLPAWCNWVCGQALPKIDPNTKNFVEPLLPFEQISILHVTPREMSVQDIQSTDGRRQTRQLDYLAHESEIAASQKRGE